AVGARRRGRLGIGAPAAITAACEERGDDRGRSRHGTRAHVTAPPLPWFQAARARRRRRRAPTSASARSASAPAAVFAPPASPTVRQPQPPVSPEVSFDEPP